MHVPLMGGRASACQEFPKDLCKAICRGILKQKLLDAEGHQVTGGMNQGQMYSLMCRVIDEPTTRRLRARSEHRPMMKPIGGWRCNWVDCMHEHEGGSDEHGGRIRNGVEEMKKHMSSLYERGGMPEAWDDVNNVFLDPEEVKKARAIEMDFFRKLGVYKRVPKSRIKELSGKLISTKWIDTNKGDRDKPNHRSRLVGREFNEGRDDTLYASTPPLEALRYIVSHAATEDPERPGIRRELMINDVRRAYFYAKQKRNVFINLPSEDPDAKEGEVGQLLLCLYGTRDAAKEWQGTLSDHLRTLGFVPGIGHPSVFKHEERGLCVLVHGNDYKQAASPDSSTGWRKTWGRNLRFKPKGLEMGPDENLKGRYLIESSDGPRRVMNWRRTPDTPS